MEPWSLLGLGMTLFLMLAGELEIVWKPLSLLLLATDDRRLPLLISATSLYFVVILSFYRRRRIYLNLHTPDVAE